MQLSEGVLCVLYAGAAWCRQQQGLLAAGLTPVLSCAAVSAAVQMVMLVCALHSAVYRACDLRGFLCLGGVGCFCFWFGCFGCDLWKVDKQFRRPPGVLGVMLS